MKTTFDGFGIEYWYEQSIFNLRRRLLSFPPTCGTKRGTVDHFLIHHPREQQQRVATTAAAGVMTTLPTDAYTVDELQISTTGSSY